MMMLASSHGTANVIANASNIAAGLVLADMPNFPRTKCAKLVVLPQLGQGMLNIS